MSKFYPVQNYCKIVLPYKSLFYCYFSNKCAEGIYVLNKEIIDMSKVLSCRLLQKKHFSAYKKASPAVNQ